MAKKSTIKKKDINLLPRQYSKRSAAVPQVDMKIFIAMFIVSIVLVAGSFVGLLVWEGVVNKLDTGYKEEINKYSVVETVIKDNDTVKKDLASRRAFMASAFGTYKQTDLLQWFGGSIPKGSGMKFTSYSSDLTTISTTISGKRLKDFSEYVKNIRKAGMYPTLKMQTINSDSNKNNLSGTVQASFQTQQLTN